MSKSTKIVGLIIGAVVAAAVYSLAVLVGPGFFIGCDVGQAKTRLFCETDHQALLDACRELSKRYVDGQLDSGEPLASSPQVPEVIRALRPSFVAVDQDGCVRIELSNKWWPLGVRAYPENYPEYPPPFEYGDRKLLEGLWYCEDGYSLHPDEYDKIIDELLSKNRTVKGTTARSDPNSSQTAEHSPQP